MMQCLALGADLFLLCLILYFAYKNKDFKEYKISYIFFIYCLAVNIIALIQKW